eukprot:TRINITY_DN1838_c0_g3_i1.p1 TRINITY_DN1838_c0_g3~~TRINITY_DN1838_c0_g3_i1.p1  ORF type:complete len:241 (+),score=31.72 TRINITY_DN1838_c0_g3_i1:108-830(+)
MSNAMETERLVNEIKSAYLGGEVNESVEEEIKGVRRLLNSFGSTSDEKCLMKFADMAAECGRDAQNEIAKMVGKLAMSRVGRKIGIFEELCKVSVVRAAERTNKTLLLVSIRKGIPIDLLCLISSYTPNFGTTILFELATRAKAATPEGFLSTSLLSRVIVRAGVHCDILLCLAETIAAPTILAVKFNHLSVLLETSQEFLISIGTDLLPLRRKIRTSAERIADPTVRDRVYALLGKMPA